MRRYLLGLVPTLMGLGLAVLLQARFWPDPILYLRADAGTALLLLGLGLGAACIGGLALWDAAGRRSQIALASLRQEQAEEHRRFIRRLDHELKNPLTAIRAGLANLPRQDEGSVLASVRAQVGRLAHLSADLRKLADLETQPLEQEPVEVAALLTELVESVQERPEAAERRLQLTLPRAPWPLPSVVGDRDLLFLALYNLLDNAFKFSHPGDTIEIRAYEDGATVAVEVADTGPGVPEEDLPHLGEELYRGSAPRTVEGSGLGLALVQAIVVRHGGSKAVRSRLGKGTAVTLRFPVTR